LEKLVSDASKKPVYLEEQAAELEQVLGGKRKIRSFCCTRGEKTTFSLNIEFIC
jgi:hypothetical protein